MLPLCAAFYCMLLAGEQGCRAATLQEQDFLEGAGALKVQASNGMPTTVVKAITACSRARAPAALLPAMGGIAQLGPYTALTDHEICSARSSS